LAKELTMFAECKKIVAVLLGAALLAGLGASNTAWARGGRGGGGGYRGGNYNNGGYNNGGYNRGYNNNTNNSVNRGYNGAYGAGYRGMAGGRYGANSGFASRHFANSNLAAGAAANRMGMMGPYGMGYGGLGYGGIGGMGYGMGYPFFGMYGMMGMGMMGMGGMGMGGMGMGMGGMGMGGGGGGGGGGYGGGGGGYAQTPATNTPAANTAANPATPPAEQVASADAFDVKGEADFKAGNYPAAIQDWQHALVDTPHNGGDMLLLAQSLFASGQYQPAAGAVQLGMQMLPQEQWGNVLKHFADLYPNNQAFTDQLRALEKSRKTNPNDPATRFLLGYEYGYLGYPKQAVAELDKAIGLRPQDRGAVVMRNQFAAQAGLPALPVPKLPATPGKPGPADQSKQPSQPG
jgi:tetratricopeptide (TPR) repeat protein